MTDVSISLLDPKPMNCNPHASMQQQSCDERFHTPRASASSSRSENSGASSSFATPRDTITSARSMSSSDSESIYRTPRSTYMSPVPPGDRGHDRSRDLRRFSHRPATSLSNYNLQSSSSSEAVNMNMNRHRDYELAGRGKLPTEPNLNLFSLARHGRVGEVEELLLRGVSVAACDENGNQILHIACQNGKKKMAKLALKYGADINATNATSNSALHFCIKYQNHSLCQYLLSKGADPNIINNEGRLCSEVG